MKGTLEWLAYHSPGTVIVRAKPRVFAFRNSLG
jgi:hypothetical protein